MSINNVTLLGNLTRTPEITEYGKGKNAGSLCKFTIACNRPDGENCDFINVTAFGKTGDFVSEYFDKGDAIAVVGRISTGSYENKDGQTVYTTEVIANSVSFTGGKNPNKKK